MGTHRVEATDQLTDLIDRAERGEEVVLTRQGRPVATITPVEKPVSAEAVQWLIANRVKGRKGRLDAGALLREIRDEGER
ncbi:type II toxin-antitoxin system Phd/YefM family antitoxin [Rhodoplanes azumiensis]|uniref:Type II toxin-antitoxin system Phd/YefM family antitoxin n=1 Tax=Rhodoplanes azumiensis TaxID=1897628 RepID=A0ABW5AKJ2_9BRAD